MNKLLVISGANGFDYLKDTEVIGKTNFYFIISPLDENHLKGSFTNHMEKILNPFLTTHTPHMNKHGHFIDHMST